MEPVTLRTRRLVLDTPRPTDAATIAAHCTDPLFERFLTTPWPYTRAHADGFIAGAVPDGWAADAEYTWALRTGSDGELLGVISVRRAHGDIGFWLGSPHRGNGYMAEAAAGVADWGLRTLGLPRVLWQGYPDNTASAVTARRAGFAYTGVGPALAPGRDGTHPACLQGEVTLSTDPAEAAASWPADTPA